MSGIVGSRLNTRGSGLVGSLGSDGHALTSSGAGERMVFEAAGGGGDLNFGGDTFGADKTIGSNDNYALNIEAQNDRILRFEGTGKMSTQDEEAGYTTKGGITIHQGNDSTTGIADADADGRAITFKGTGVAHGATDVDETDTYGIINHANAADGMFMIRSFAEGEAGFALENHSTNEDTSQSTNAGQAVTFSAYKISGTGRVAMGTTANMFCFNNGGGSGRCRFIVRGDGNIYSDGSHNTYDAYDDISLTRALDTTINPAGIIANKWDKFVKYNEDNLMDAGILGSTKLKDGTDDAREKTRPMVCITQLQKLHNGAIWQQYSKHNQLLEAVYDLAKEAVGEEKADAILKKHEIKLLN